MKTGRVLEIVFGIIVLAMTFLSSYSFGGSAALMMLVYWFAYNVGLMCIFRTVTWDATRYPKGGKI